jgi:DNA-binding LacI/PurR family transcriptional regulator
MPTIKDVAKQAGVSIATVSYVLNNRYDMVGERTREQVLRVARDLGYKANITARNLQASRTGLIGYAWHRNPTDQHHFVMNDFIYHLAQAAEAQNYHLLTFTHPSADPIAVYSELIQSGRVDGFIIADTVYNDPRIRYLIDRDFPFVSFGRANPSWDFHWIDTDGEVGMRMATEYLLEIGHRRIAFLGWPHDSLSGNHRLAGYQAALQNVGISIRDDYIVHNDYAHGSIECAFEYWLARPVEDRPTAIIAVSDYVAVAAIRAAEQYGFQVGRTLSVIGFDDAPFVSYFQPGLTTLSQPFATITSHLVTQLDAIIQGTPSTPKTCLVPPTLVIRASSVQPPVD